MILKTSLTTVVTVIACCVCAIEASSTRHGSGGNPNPRRRTALSAADGAERAQPQAQASEISYLQPYESLEVLQSKYGLGAMDPMSTAASHHHKKGSKGWLDMGAWTKKKGAFGWYADYPVGKGRR